MYYLYEKYYKPIAVQYYRAHGVSWVPMLTLLDLQMLSWNGTRSYVEDLLYILQTHHEIQAAPAPQFNIPPSKLYFGFSHSKFCASVTVVQLEKTA